MKHIILGTAGHVDHGKTSLIKALTGIDTDRLPEEKARGITIELGFAPLRYGDELLVGIVDVPGHEKFVGNMLLGTTGIDIVLLCIAADEGIKQQTQEHLNICKILGIKKCVVALTKADVVDENQLENVKNAIASFLKGSVFEGSEIVPASMNGIGIENLKASIKKIAASIKEKRSDGNFRLWIDRVFTIKGFGTVVTGTSLRGNIKTGDSVNIYSKDTKPYKATVRQLESFGGKIEKAGGGVRLGINLGGVEIESIHRGDLIGLEDRVIRTGFFDAVIENLEDSGLGIKSGQKFKIAFGTTEEMCTLRFISKEKKFVLKPGSKGFARIILDGDSYLEFGERFVLRNLTPLKTIGGGMVFDPQPRKTISDADEYAGELVSMADLKIEDCIQAFVNRSRFSGLTAERMNVLLDRVFNVDEIKDGISRLLSAGIIVLLPSGLVSQENVKMAKDQIRLRISDFQRLNPLKGGIKFEELKKTFSKLIPGKTFEAVVDLLIAGGAIEKKSDFLRLCGDTVLSEIDRKRTQEIVSILSKSQSTPPAFKELRKEIDVMETKLKDYLRLLSEKGEIVKVSEEFYFKADVIKELKMKLAKAIKEKGSISVTDFKVLTGTSRKYSIPLIEYFDRERITLRKSDDTRILGPNAIG